MCVCVCVCHNIAAASEAHTKWRAKAHRDTTSHASLAAELAVTHRAAIVFLPIPTKTPIREASLVG